MQRPRRATPSEIYKQPDRQIHCRHCILIKNSGIPLGFAGDHGVRDLLAAVSGIVPDDVGRAPPRPQRDQRLRRLNRASNPESFDRNQHVARPQSRAFARTPRRDIHRHHAVGIALIDPRDPVVGQVIAALLLEIDRRGEYRRHGDDHQQRADELALEFLHPARDTTPSLVVARRRPPEQWSWLLKTQYFCA